MNAPSLILFDTGELGDVRALLASMEVAVCPAQEVPGQDAQPDLLVTTAAGAEQLAREGVTPARPTGVWIAIVGEDSPESEALSPEVFDFVVRRPVHPEGLRMLFQHVLFRGPERRRSPRVPVGLPVRFFWSQRPRSGTLLDVSRTACRILTQCDVLGRSQAPDIGQPVNLSLPESFTGGERIVLQGNSMRRAPGREPRTEEFIVAFSTDSEEAHAKLCDAVERALGKRRLAEGGASAAAPVAEADAAADTETAEPDCEVATASERRREPRRRYDRKVVTLGGGSVRVLVGRDLSLGGVRVIGREGLAEGDRVELVLYGRPREVPLTVIAEVARDDGPGGRLLRFIDLSDESAAYLRKISAALPILDEDAAGAGDGAVLMTERA